MAGPLSVAVDATVLLGVPTGIAALTRGLLEGLACHEGIDLSAYALSLRGWGRLRQSLPAGLAVHHRAVPAGLLLRAWEVADRPQFATVTGGRATVVHGTNFVVPPARRSARVVSVHDLTALRYPELAGPASLRYPALVARALAGGAFVHVLSNFVADEVIDHYGADRARVRVVHPPVRLTAHDATPGEPPYVLALGTAEPRKDLPGLVAAFDRIAATRPDLRLILAGPPGWGEGELADALGAARHRDRITRTGWVEDRDALLAGAAVLAYPSRYEGFGLPPLEAMAAGVPVVATRAGAIPEVVGDAAVLVEPEDSAALADALSTVLDDGALRDRLVAAGRERVGAYNYPDAIEGMARLYRDAASSL